MIVTVASQTQNRSSQKILMNYKNLVLLNSFVVFLFGKFLLWANKNSLRCGTIVSISSRFFVPNG